MSFRFRFALTALSAIALGLLTPAALRADSCTAAGNLVQNCSFSTGSFAGWTVTDAASGSSLAVNPGYGHNGDHGAWFGAVDEEYDTIAQTLSTTPGEEYTLTFWLDDTAGDGSDSNKDFQALWNGTSLLDQYTTTGVNVEYIFTVDGTGDDTLSFEGYNAPSYYILSDISLTPDETAVTPEPSSFLLLGTGLLGFAGLLRRRYARG